MTSYSVFTKPLGEKGDHLIEQATGTVDKLDELLVLFVDFSRKLNNQDGTLGKLLAKNR